SSHRDIVCSLSVALRIGLGAFVWCEHRDSPTRRPLLPLNAGTAEPFRVSPPEAVAYHLELSRSTKLVLTVQLTGERAKLAATASGVPKTTRVLTSTMRPPWRRLMTWAYRRLGGGRRCGLGEAPRRP